MKKIEIKHLYALPVSTVYQAFLSADTAKNFLFRTDAGELLVAEVSPEVGGSFLITEKREDQVVEHNGTFIELEENEKISFTFVAEKNMDPAFIELFFKKTASGSEITLVQELPDGFEKYDEMAQKGWSMILARLEKYLSAQGGATGPAITKDSNGKQIEEGDTVRTIKDLNVKGSSMVVKRGTVVKKVHLIAGNDEEVDCKVDGVALRLETQWLAKV